MISHSAELKFRRFQARLEKSGHHIAARELFFLIEEESRSRVEQITQSLEGQRIDERTRHHAPLAR